jgi:hypothetical protein
LYWNLNIDEFVSQALRESAGVESEEWALLQPAGVRVAVQRQKAGRGVLLLPQLDDSQRVPVGKGKLAGHF